MSTPRVLVVGELCVDLVIRLGADLRFGQHEQIAPSTVLTMGSSSAITACGIAALGLPVDLVSVRGDDTFGRFLDEELRRRGVGTAFVRVDRGVATGVSTHLTRPGGDRAIVTTMGSIGCTTASDAPGSFDGFAHLHSGSYFLQEALWGDAAGLYARARAAGLSTSLDGNFDPSGRWDAGIREVLRHVDVFFGNEQEILGICGASGLSDASGLTGASGLPGLDEAIASLLAAMPWGATVVCKLGAAGATAVRLEEGRPVRVSAVAPSLDAPLVDTVGAGDTLAAGFLSARLRGQSPEESLALAVACGTASTRGAGGVGAQPDLDAARRLAATVRIGG